MLRILSHQNVTNFAATKMLHILSPPKCYKPSRHQNVANALSPPKCYKCCRHIDKCCRHILGRYKIIVSPKVLRTLSPPKCISLPLFKTFLSPFISYRFASLVLSVSYFLFSQPCLFHLHPLQFLSYFRIFSSRTAGGRPRERQ